MWRKAYIFLIATRTKKCHLSLLWSLCSLVRIPAVCMFCSCLAAVSKFGRGTDQHQIYTDGVIWYFSSSVVHICCWLCFLFYWAKDTTECPRCCRGPFATVWPVSVGVSSSFTHDIEFEVRLKVVIRFANVFRLHTYLSLFLWSQQQHTKFETTVGQKADLVVSRFLEVT